MQTLNHAPDHFVLCGEAYLDMREALTQSIVDESVDHFKQHIEVHMHLGCTLAFVKLFHCFHCCVDAACLSCPCAAIGAV